MVSIAGKSTWRERAGTIFTCEKQPAHGCAGMVVTMCRTNTMTGQTLVIDSGRTFH